MELHFCLEQNDNKQEIIADINHLIIAGWTGRDQNAVLHHIEELALLGVPRPKSIPVFYRVAINQLSQEHSLEVVGNTSSGEVEPFIFSYQNELYVSIASDHTDRKLEAHSVALSKQICVKPVATTAWKLSEIIEHWDQLILRSWIKEKDQITLYQEGSVASFRHPLELYEKYTGSSAIKNGIALSCGTTTAIGGIRPSCEFHMELVDNVLNRSLKHHYKVVELPIVE